MTSDPTAGGVVAELVRVRRLTDQEGRKLQQIVRRGSTSSVRYRREMMLLPRPAGTGSRSSRRLVQADEDTVRDVIHRFNEIGLSCLGPSVGGRSFPPAQRERRGLRRPDSGSACLSTVAQRERPLPERSKSVF